MNDLVPVVQEHTPLELFKRSTEVASVCGEIVKRTARQIQGRKYVQVEGWQSIAVAYGCIASATKVERIEGGMRAVGELRRASDGALLATAEGFVGEDEATWYGGESRGKTLPKRPDFAIRAMAQTRAISRVCRTAFAFVVVLIDNKLATTPAEEMVHDVGDPDITEEIPMAPPADCITADQHIVIMDELKGVANGEARLKKAVGVDRLTAIPAKDYARTLEWIKKAKEPKAAA